MARKEARLLLHGFDIAEQTVQSVEEAVTELASNAQRHAPAPWQLRVYASYGWLWFALFDAGVASLEQLRRRVRAAMGPPDPLAIGGRGLFLVQSAFSLIVRPAVSEVGGSPGKEVMVGLPLPTEASPLPAA
ncbi:ATP-binding protein [Salinactinospora qingdaonensis]|uniref:Anti-sigma regulatory factor (Ser/Thr protein kinase) n=1 Tax=Salinactinospora qingdaonensis TaxID=702744 RepID=A0ABP7FU44_9ACTN